MINRNKVAVIGAGIAGLSCSTALKNAGFQVTIFEKSHSVSGRLSTRVSKNWQCDHGAQYFTARDPLFYAEVERWKSANVAQLWQPSLKVFDGKNFTKKNEKESKTLRYVGYPRNNSPANWLAHGLNVLTESTVNSIHKQENQWQVSSKEDGLHVDNFDFLILAIPPPQAALFLNNTKSDLAKLCAGITMQPCFALMVRFNQIINCQFDGLFINTGLLSWAARDSSKPGRRQGNLNQGEIWVLHASSQWSEAHVDDAKDSVAQQMLEEFTKILHFDDSLSTIATIALVPQSYDLHRWLYADCESYLMDVYEFDSEQNIGLCGDWLNNGKVQGAWLSGLKLAHELTTMASS